MAPPLFDAADPPRARSQPRTSSGMIRYAFFRHSEDGLAHLARNRATSSPRCAWDGSVTIEDGSS